MVYCRFCKKEIEPYPIGNNRWRCPICNKFVLSPNMKGEEREEPQTIEESRTEKAIGISKTIKLSASNLHMAEILINAGYAKDLNDLIRKNMKFSFTFIMENAGKQINDLELNKEPNPEKTMEIQREINEAFLNDLKDRNLNSLLNLMLKNRNFDPLLAILLIERLKDKIKEEIKK